MEVWQVLRAIGSVVWLTVMNAPGKPALVLMVAVVSVAASRLLAPVGAAWLAAAVSIVAGYVHAYLAYLLADLAPVGGGMALFGGWILAFPTALAAILIDRSGRRGSKPTDRLDA